MRRIIGGVFQSLDGVMQAPGGPEEDPTGGFTLGGWSANYWDDVLGGAMGALFANPYDLLLGRKTYDVFAAHWPHAADGPDAETAAQFNSIAKYVVTGSDAPLDWNNSHRIGGSGDVAAELRALKDGDGPDLMVQGSSTLYPLLFAERLIDRVQLMTFPVVLGGGKTIFGAGLGSGALRLVDHKVASTGVIIAVYEPAGEVETGSFALAEPSDAELARRERMAREG